ncbi:hypothetical protein [Rheinheimera sp.]|uniref:hypothetical protein n=1 Tax=Rheinheimera sp. TaxID=1869214 RepID=UPI0027B98D6F|nr:hypothetical protein [Rheinheimera sp.]
MKENIWALSIMILLMLKATPAVANTCVQVLQAKELAGALNICFPQARASWGWDPSGSEEFGSPKSPSKAAVLAKELANSGVPDFQFFYAMVLKNYLYQLSPRDDFELVEQLTKETKTWLHKAAEGGQEQAMHLHISHVYRLGKSLQFMEPPTAQEKSEALHYLAKFDLANANFPSDVQQVIEQIDTAESPETAPSIKDTDDYAALPETQLFELANAVRTGNFGKEILDANPTRSAPMFRLLIDKYQNTAAAVIYRADIADKDKQVELMRWASEKNNYDAMVWYGAYLVCNNKKIDGLVLLKKAKAAKNESATSVLNDIAKEGTPANCYEGWLY